VSEPRRQLESSLLGKHQISLHFTCFQENGTQVKERIPSTLQIIISRISGTHHDTKTDEVEHCSTEEIHVEEQIVVDDDKQNDDNDN
jgi:hypothetical protein